MKTVIVTDSTSDLTISQAKELDIEIVSLIVTFGEKSYVDAVELIKEDFFKMLSQSEELPVTSQPSPEDFVKVFEKHKKEGNEVVYIGISSILSGTFQSAQIAKEMVDYDKIYLVDTLSAAFGVEAMVRIALDLREKNVSAKEISNILIEKRDNLKILAAVDTLKYLIKGGRVSKAAGAIGGILNLKPIIELKEGAIVSTGKARGQKGAFELIAKSLMEANIDTDLPIIITNADDNQAMLNFAEYLKDKNINYNWSFAQVGSTIGTHTGPGCVGICYFEK